MFFTVNSYFHHLETFIPLHFLPTYTAAQMSDAQALSVLMKSPVTHEMVSHIVNVTLKVIQCKKSKVLPSPPSSPNGKSSNKHLPSLMTFISRLVRYSNVYTGTLLNTLVYLERLSAKLPKNAQGLPCTLHRIFLAALIISAKFHNDSSPKNKHWAKYTDGLFTVEEINLMERQLLQLMNWDVIVSESELSHALRRFTEPIKQDLKKAVRIRRSISKQRLQQSCSTTFSSTSSPPQYQYTASSTTTPSPIHYPVAQTPYTNTNGITPRHMRSQSSSSISSIGSSISSSPSTMTDDDEVLTARLAQVQYAYQPQMKSVDYPMQGKGHSHGIDDDEVFLTSLWGSSV